MGDAPFQGTDPPQIRTVGVTHVLGLYRDSLAPLGERFYPGVSNWLRCQREGGSHAAIGVGGTQRVGA